MISGATGIPSRILTGSERGELASSQDVDSWNTRVDERRIDYAEPMILRTYINTLIAAGVVPQPIDGKYKIEWPAFTSLNPKDRAEVAERLSRAVAAYVTSGADLIIPPQIYLTAILGMSEQEAAEVMTEFLAMADEERVLQQAMGEEGEVVIEEDVPPEEDA